MKREGTDVKSYIENLPDSERLPLESIYKVIKTNLPKGFEEALTYGMIGFVVPHSIYPKGYHCDPKQPLPFINLAAQKNYIALYHLAIYADEKLLEWFKEEYAKQSKTKLDMGKSCIRFKKNSDIPLKLIGELVQKMSVEKWIQLYEQQFSKK